MKKLLKWTLIIGGPIVVLLFSAFLYLIPPFTIAPPDEFIEPERNAPPGVDSVANDAERAIAERAIAERGRYLVLSIGCTGCHTAGGDKGPKFETAYLAGGRKFLMNGYGTAVSRNLTPDTKSGLARRSDAQVLRTLRSGVSADDGRVFSPFMMPWGEFSTLSEEDRYAIVRYLRLLKGVPHTIPPFDPKADAPALAFYGLDYSIPDGQK